MGKHKKVESMENDQRVERLVEMMDVFGLNEAKVGVLTNLTKGTIFNYTLKRAEITDSFIENLCKAVPDLNLKWMKNGKGKISPKDVKSLFKTRNFSIKRSVSFDIADRIVEVREHYKMNQTEFANSLDINPDLQRNIESMRQNPTIGYLELLAKKKEVNITYIVSGKGSCIKDENELKDEIIEAQRLEIEDYKTNSQLQLQRIRELQSK